MNGADTLWRAAGADTLWRGGGNDAFVFREMGATDADRISDFAAAAQLVAALATIPNIRVTDIAVI